MANAVEKMFDMTLFNSLTYFPDSATNPDKFWDAIKELEQELGIEICITQISASPNNDQVKIAKRFCRNFSIQIRKNPWDWKRMRRISKGQECIEDYSAELMEFHYSIKEFFKVGVRSLVRSGAMKKFCMF